MSRVLKKLTDPLTVRLTVINMQPSGFNGKIYNNGKISAAVNIYMWVLMKNRKLTYFIRVNEYVA